MIEKRTKQNYFLLVVLFLAVLRGSSYLFIKDVINIYSPFEIVFYRFFLTGIFLLLVYGKKSSKLTKWEIILGILAGIFLFSAFGFQTYGLKYTTVSKQSFFTSLYIVIIPLLDFIFFKKKIASNLIIFFLLILVGLFLISFKSILNFELSFNYGDLLTIFCAFGFALNILLMSKIDKFDVNVINLTIVQMLVIGVLSFVFQFMFVGKMVSGLSFNFSLFYLVFVCTMLNFLLQNISQRYVSAHIMGLILSTEAIFGTIFAVIFLKELLTLNFIIGTILITVGVVFIQYFDKKNRN